ncbi:MAG: diguanylate cyclase [Negativicutes bacterium]|nr:diguanylate cyclase [Negativicutes bacterium]
MKNLSFRQKLSGVFILLLSLILLHGAVAWFALQELSVRFSEWHAVEHVLEMTVTARMNEKTYALTGERRFAVLAAEELEEARDLLTTVRRDSSLSVKVWPNMAGALDRYTSTFSQYVIYEDQHRALQSEGSRLNEEFLATVGELRTMYWPTKDADINQFYWFLLLAKSGQGGSEGDRVAAVLAGREVAALTDRLRQAGGNTEVRLAGAHAGIIASDYLLVLDKLKALQDRQRSNEYLLETAASDMLTLEQAADEQLKESARQHQSLSTSVMITVFLLSLAIALGGTVYLSARLLRPLRDLASVTAALGQGRFKERVGVQGEDEFRSLLTGVNQMAENIENLNSNMEQMVEDRTKALELEKVRFEKLFENSPEGILIFDEEMRVLNVNPAFTAIFGYTLADIIDRQIFDFLITDEIADISQHLLLFEDGDSAREETTRLRKDGSLAPVSIARFSFRQFGERTLYYAIYTDISERKAAEAQLHFLSFHDSLTAVKNRTYFELEMGKLQLSGEICGVIVCDIDGLKTVNDHWGHPAGDQLLQDAAQVLTGAAGQRALARVGGDEFVIFLPDGSEEETHAMVAAIYAGVENSFRERTPALRLSVGCAWRPDGSIGMAELYSEADNKMYDEKKRHRQHLA